MEEKIPVELIVKYLSNVTTSDEQEHLFEWVASDPAHQQLFNEYVAAWGKEVLPVKKFDANAALKKVNAAIDQEESRKRKSTWIRIAAAVAILALASVSTYLVRIESAPKWIVRTVAPGEKASVQLSDGTRVKINSGGTLKYPEQFSDKNRVVYLTGEAFFDVTPDKDHPFLIHAGVTTTRVLGTSFVIQEQPEKIMVAVATGSVQVSANGKTEFLLPYQKVTWTKTSDAFSHEKTSLVRELAWNQNTILFENDSLQDAVRVLERWYGVTITFENKKLSTCLISGRFNDEPLSRVLEAIEYSLGVTCVIKDKQVIIKGTGCN